MAELTREIKLKLQANIWKIAVADFLFSFGLIGAIYILFFQFLGFSFQNIGLFELITSIAILVTDLPTGVLADVIGRKWTVFIANIFMLIMALILGFGSGGLIILLLAGLFNGLEYSFKSGAKTALLYDTLKELKREKEFLKISGRISSFSTVSKIIGLLLGVYLFTINPRFPYYLWAVFIVLSLFFLMRIYEPIKYADKYSLKGHWKDMKTSVSFIFKNKKLLWIVVFFLIADVFSESYWDIFSQGHLESVGVPVALFGILFTIFAGANAVISYFADAIEKKLGEKKSLFMIIIVQGVLFFVMAYFDFNIALIVSLIFFTTSRSFGHLLQENYENAHIPSKNRASILSAASFLRNSVFGGAIIIWLFGYSIDSIGGTSTLYLSGGLVLIFGLFMLFIRYSKSYVKSLN